MIIKPKMTKNYTVVPNELIQSQDLSKNAKLIGVFMASLPTNWIVNTKHLSKVLGIGDRSVQRGIKELVDLHFIQKIQMVDDKTNKFTAGWTIIFVNNEMQELNEGFNVTEELEPLNNGLIIKQEGTGAKQKANLKEKPERESKNRSEAESIDSEAKFKEELVSPEELKEIGEEEQISEELEEVSSEENKRTALSETEELKAAAEKEESLKPKSPEEEANLEEQKQRAKALIEADLKRISPKEADAGEFKESKDLENSTPTLTTKSRQAGNCRAYISKEFLQSKNSYLMRNFKKNILIVFEKAKLKRDFLDFSQFSELEKEKIKEWFSYKASQNKRLNLYSKQTVLKSLFNYKLKDQNILSIIDKSIQNGWQGLYALKKSPFSAKKQSQNEILKELLKQRPDFDFSESFDLSGVRINNQAVKYDLKKDEFTLVRA